jgi:hypothetical protein
VAGRFFNLLARRNPELRGLEMSNLKKIPASSQPAIIDTAEAVSVAETALQTARDRVIAARAIVKITRETQGDALMAWFTGVPNRPRTTADLVRENIRRETERKLAIARGEIEPETVAAVRYPSPIDEVLASGRRGGNVNVNRARQPGRLIQPPKSPR